MPGAGSCVVGGGISGVWVAGAGCFAGSTVCLSAVSGVSPAIGPPVLEAAVGATDATAGSATGAGFTAFVSHV